MNTFVGTIFILSSLKSRVCGHLKPQRFVCLSPVMPKSKKSMSQGCKAIPDTPQPIKMSNNAVEIKIIAKPAAKLSEITALTEDGLCVSLAAPPVDGEANTELVKFIAKQIGTSKSNVCLIKGMKNKQKMICVYESSQDEIEAKIKEILKR